MRVRSRRWAECENPTWDEPGGRQPSAPMRRCSRSYAQLPAATTGGESRRRCGASPGADVAESRRRCGRVPAQMWPSPGADVANRPPARSPSVTAREAHCSRAPRPPRAPPALRRPGGARRQRGQTDCMARRTAGRHDEVRGGAAGADGEAGLGLGRADDHDAVRRAARERAGGERNGGGVERRSPAAALAVAHAAAQGGQVGRRG